MMPQMLGQGHKHHLVVSIYMLLVLLQNSVRYHILHVVYMLLVNNYEMK